MDANSRAQTERQLKSWQKWWEIMSHYQPLHMELYTMNAGNFFVPSFIEAINQNTEQAFRNIMPEVSPGIFSFEMLQPRICELFMAEIEHFEQWVHQHGIRIRKPNKLHQHGVILEDVGMDTMLSRLMEEFVRPISTVFFPDVGGQTVDSHYSFIFHCGADRNVNLGVHRFHRDEVEVTLNVCLGKQFSGGELLFRGILCENHSNTKWQPEEVFDYTHVPGRALLYRGSHRHVACDTTSGNRTNLVLWCCSSDFKEQCKDQTNFPWCKECERENIAATKQKAEMENRS